MMKHLLPALAATALVLGAAVAPAQTFTKLGDVVLSGIDTSPVDAVVVGNDAYVAGFGQRKLIKITNVLTDSPSAAQLADVGAASTTPYGSGRGLQTIRTNGAGQLVIGGDVGSGLHGNVFIYGTDGTLVTQLGPASGFSNTARRISGAVEIGLGRYLLTETGSNLYTTTPALDAFAGSINISLGHGTARDILLIGTDIYVSTTFTGGTDKIVKLSGGDASVGNTLNYTAADWYDYGITTSNAARGIDRFTYGGVDYIATTTGATGQIRFVNTTTATAAAFNIDADVDENYGVTVVTSGANQYVLVSQVNVGGGNGRLTIFGVDGATLTTGPTAAEPTWMNY